MFGLFAPKCPVDIYDKTWIERQMRWLVQVLGVDRIQQTLIVTPTDDFFPERYDKEGDNAWYIFQQIAHHLQVDINELELAILPRLVDTTGTGFDERPIAITEEEKETKVVKIVGSLLESPMKMIATFAREFCRHILLTRNIITEETEGREKIIDLASILLGFGIFNANAAILETPPPNTIASWWTVGRVGELEGRVRGYALAIWAFLRDDNKPAWRHHLRGDASHAFETGLKYLKKTNDTLCHPDTIRERVSVHSIPQLVEHIRTRTPTWQVAAFWEIRERKIVDREIIEAVAIRTNDRDGRLAQAAALAMHATAQNSQKPSDLEIAVPALFRALGHPSDEVKYWVAMTLAELRLHPEEVVPELNHLIKDLSVRLHLDDGDMTEKSQSSRLAAYLCVALGKYGPAATLALPRIMDVLVISLVELNSVDIEVTLKALHQISPDPIAFARSHFGFQETTHRDLVLREIKLFQSTVGKLFCG